MTNTGPCLASDGSRLYMAYISHQDTSVFWAWCDNKSGNFSDWQGNEKVQLTSLTGSFTLTSTSTPALVIYQGRPVILVIDEQGFLLTAFYDGNQWHTLSYSWPYGGRFPLPLVSVTAVVIAGQIVAAITNHIGYTVYLWGGQISQNTIFSFQGATRPIETAASAQHVSLVSTPNYPYALSQYPGKQTEYFYVPNASTLASGAFPGGLLEPGSGSPAIGFGASIIWWSNQIEIIYQGSSNALYAASFKSFLTVSGIQNMLLNPSVPITSKTVPPPPINLLGGSTAANDTAGGIVRTSAPLSVIVHQNNICIAHKGAYTSNLYLAYAHA